MQLQPTAVQNVLVKSIPARHSVNANGTRECTFHCHDDSRKSKGEATQEPKVFKKLFKGIFLRHMSTIKSS